MIVGWWHSGCGTVNLNGINSNTQLNTNVVTAYNGIVWYPFFTSTSGRGTSLEVDGGSWATFKATEMKIFSYVPIVEGKNISIKISLDFCFSKHFIHIRTKALYYLSF